MLQSFVSNSAKSATRSTLTCLTQTTRRHTRVPNRLSTRPYSHQPQQHSKHSTTTTTSTTNHHQSHPGSFFSTSVPASSLYTPSMVLMAVGMRQGVWSVSPHKTPEVHVQHDWEQNDERRQKLSKQPLEKSRENFDLWIESVLRQRGLAGTAESFTPEQNEVDAKIKTRLEDVLDRIERYHAKPELYVWCRHFLKDIFRFSNEEGMSKSFDVILGSDDMKNMIRYKTFIEKERYKMMRDRESITELQLQFSNNLDALQEYFAHINPRTTAQSRFIHPNMKPIYDSLSLSLASVLEVSDMVAVLHPFFVNYDTTVAKALEEDRPKDALRLIQQQAAFARGVSKISRGLLEYLDTTLYKFEEYYNPARVRNFSEYIRLEADPNRRYKLDSLGLPTPPNVEIDSDALYRAIGDATEGVVGNYEPESPPYYPLEHIPFTEKLIAQQSGKQKQTKSRLTPDERNTRFKLANEDLEEVKVRRAADIARLQEVNLHKSLKGYSNEELNELGAKFHLAD